MSRLDYLTIGIVALCIAALIYLVYRYVNLPNNPEAARPTTEAVEKDTTSSTITNLEGFPAEDSSDTALPGPGAEADPAPKTESNNPPKTENIKPITTPVKPVEPPVEKPSSRESAVATASGQYMVIAGSFEQKSGAQKQLQKIKKLGYNNARVELFNRGTYAVVLVDRFDEAAAAKALVNTLKKQGFDAMMKIKK